MKNNLNSINLHQKPVTFFLILGLIVGILFCVFIPYGAGFDEQTHIVRIFDISDFHLLPNTGKYTFGEFYTLSYQRRNFETPATDHFEKQLFMLKPNWDSMADGQTRSNYFPLVYLPQAFVAGLVWRVFDWPILPGIMAIRLINLLIYFFLCYLAQRNLPTGKLIFLVIAFLPMSLYQASTINGDGMTNAICFLFMSYILKLILNKDLVIDNKKAITISILTILVGCIKPASFVILLLLLLLVKKQYSSKKLPWVITFSALFSIFVSVWWSGFAVANYHQSKLSPSLMDKIDLVFQNLPDFIPNFFFGFFLSMNHYFHDIVGVFGYWVGSIPEITYIFAPIALLLALLYDAKNKVFSFQFRIAIFIIALVCLVGIASFQFVINYVPGTQGMGSQGRYFLQFLPILFLAFAGLFNISEKLRNLSGFLSLIFIIATLCAYSIGLYRTYYTRCVHAVTVNQPCTMPVYKNFDSKAAKVEKLQVGSIISQSIIPDCSQINSISILGKTLIANPGDTGKLQIFDDKNNLLDEQKFSIYGINPESKIVIPVELEVISGESLINLSFSLDNENSLNSELGLLVRKGAVIYPQGDLLSDGELLDGDLVFQYTCVYP